MQAEKSIPFIKREKASIMPAFSRFISRRAVEKLVNSFHTARRCSVGKVCSALLCALLHRSPSWARTRDPMINSHVL